MVNSTVPSSRTPAVPPNTPNKPRDRQQLYLVEKLSLVALLCGQGRWSFSSAEQPCQAQAGVCGHKAGSNYGDKSPARKEIDFVFIRTFYSTFFPSSLLPPSNHLTTGHSEIQKPPSTSSSLWAFCSFPGSLSAGPGLLKPFRSQIRERRSAGWPNSFVWL